MAWCRLDRRGVACNSNSHPISAPSFTLGLLCSLIDHFSWPPVIHLAKRFFDLGEMKWTGLYMRKLLALWEHNQLYLVLHMDGCVHGASLED